MHRKPAPIDDQTLGAYVDGELGLGARLEVEAALREDRSVADRMRALRQINTLVRAVVHPADDTEPQAAFAGREEPGISSGRWRMAAGRLWTLVYGSRPVLAAFATGLLVALGATLLLESPREADGQWQQLTVALHQRFVDAMQAGRAFPLDITDRDPERVGAFLAGTIGYAPALPDLSADAYVLNGARVITTSNGPVVYALYTSDRAPLLGFVAMREGRMRPRGAEAQEDVRVVAWQRDGAQFAFVGTHSAAELERLAARYRDADGVRAE